MLLAMLAFAYVHARTGWHTVWIVVQQVSQIPIINGEVTLPADKIDDIDVDYSPHRSHHLNRE
jgi:hypothetical protein